MVSKYIYDDIITCIIYIIILFYSNKFFITLQVYNNIVKSTLPLKNDIII